jgi:hypothetical protein
VKRAMWTLLAGATILSLSTLYAAEPVQFPDNFRRWVHVGTGVILPGANPKLMSEEGMHDVLANEKAIAGYLSGDFSDGAIIVYELREARQNNGVIFEGARKRVDVMIKDSSLKDTGGWRFERFWANDQTQSAIHDSGTSCFQCHSRASAHGFVFSQLDEIP